jgi:hypothetical protein
MSADAAGLRTGPAGRKGIAHSGYRTGQCGLVPKGRKTIAQRFNRFLFGVID